MTEHVTRPPGAATTAPIPTNHVHETGTLRPVWTARRSEAGSVVVTDTSGEFAEVVLGMPVLGEAIYEVRHYSRCLDRWTAVHDLLLREQEDESALVDELAVAVFPSPITDSQRIVVREVIAAYRKRAES